MVPRLLTFKADEHPNDRDSKGARLVYYLHLRTNFLVKQIRNTLYFMYKFIKNYVLKRLPKRCHNRSDVGDDYVRDATLVCCL